MKKLKKRLCGVLTFMMLILAVSMAFPGAYGAKEVQAAAKGGGSETGVSEALWNEQDRTEMESGKRCSRIPRLQENKRWKLAGTSKSVRLSDNDLSGYCCDKR